jgi:hypothetical protein
LRAGAAPTIRGDHLDPVGAHERVIERVAVVAAVADQSGGEIAEEAGLEGGGNGERSRFVQSDDLGAACVVM